MGDHLETIRGICAVILSIAALGLVGLIAWVAVRFVKEGERKEK